MAIHTVVFLDSDRALPALAPLRAVSEDVLGVITGRVGSDLDAPLAYISEDPFRLLGAVAATLSPSADGDLVQVYQPSMDVTPANIHPLNVLPLPSPVGFYAGGEHAPRLRAGEAFSARATGMMDTVLVAWVGERGDPPPAGEAFLLRFAATVNVVEGAWARGSMTWQIPSPQGAFDGFLPTGRYHVLGMSVWSSTINLYAARLVLPNQVHRPGAVVLLDGKRIPPPFQMDGSFGVWGWFEQEQPPQIEVFGTAPSGAVTLSGYVRVVRAGAQGARAGGVAWG